MTEKCKYCSFEHPDRICPRIKSIEYEQYSDGVRRVEFFAPNEYPICVPPLGFPQPQPPLFQPFVGGIMTGGQTNG